MKLKVRITLLNVLRRLKPEGVRKARSMDRAIKLLKLTESETEEQDQLLEEIEAFNMVKGPWDEGETRSRLAARKVLMNRDREFGKRERPLGDVKPDLAREAMELIDEVLKSNPPDNGNQVEELVEGIDELVDIRDKKPLV